MKKILLFSTLGIILFACKKFEHTDLEIPNCDLCEFADSLNGTYRGFASGLNAMHAYGNNAITGGDSVTMTVEQFFMHSNQYEDSTIMHFKTTYKYDSSPTIIFDTIQIRNKSGLVENKAYMKYVNFYADQLYYFETNHYIIQPDSIQIHVAVATKNAQNLPLIMCKLYRK